MCKRFLLGIVIVVVAAAPAFAGTLRVWRDCSTSMSEMEYSRAVDMLLEAIGPLIQINRVELLRFSCGNARLATARPEAFELGNRAQQLNPLSRLFRIGVDAAGGAKEEARWFDLVNRVKPALLLPPQIIASCIRFDMLAQRVANDRRPFNVILTDGWLDCQQAPPQAEFVGEIIVVVIPRTVDPISDDPTLPRSRVRDMARFFPDAAIVEPYQMERAIRTAVITNLR